MKRGTIILVRFPFTDYSSSKVRPAVVISCDNEQDLCVAFISSIIPLLMDRTDFLIKKRDLGFKQTGLKKDSVFRMRKIATLDRKIIIGKLGEVSAQIQKELDQRLRLGLGLL